MVHLAKSDKYRVSNSYEPAGAIEIMKAFADFLQTCCCTSLGASRRTVGSRQRLRCGTSSGSTPPRQEWRSRFQNRGQFYLAWVPTYLTISRPLRPACLSLCASDFWITSSVVSMIRLISPGVAPSQARMAIWTLCPALARVTIASPSLLNLATANFTGLSASRSSGA